MTAIALNAVLVLGEMFAECRLVKVVELLAPRLLLLLHVRNRHEVGQARLRLCVGRQGPHGSILLCLLKKKRPGA